MNHCFRFEEQNFDACVNSIVNALYDCLKLTGDDIVPKQVKTLVEPVKSFYLSKEAEDIRHDLIEGIISLDTIDKHVVLDKEVLSL